MKDREPQDEQKQDSELLAYVLKLHERFQGAVTIAVILGLITYGILTTNRRETQASTQSMDFYRGCDITQTVAMTSIKCPERPSPIPIWPISLHTHTSTPVSSR